MILKIKVILFVLLASFFVFICLDEYYSVKQNSYEYKMIYHFSEDSEYWKYRSIENYQKWNLIMASLTIGYIFLNVVFLIKKNKKLKYTLFFIEISLLIKIVYDFYQWYLIGFDHY